jgi:hypothetical protein
MLVIPNGKVMDTKRIIGKNWRAEEEERHKGRRPKKRVKQKHSKEEWVGGGQSYLMTDLGN